MVILYHWAADGMMIRLLLLSLLGPLTASAAGRVFIEADWQLASEPVTLTAWENDWDDGDYRRGRFAYADLQQALGFELHNWQFSYIQRRYLDGRFSRDTAEFYYRLEHDQTLSRSYQVDLEVDAFAAQGLALAYAFQTDRWRITPQLAVYRLQDYQFGRFQGASDGRQALLDTDYYFSEDKVLDYGTDGDGPEFLTTRVEPGWLYTANLDLSWRNDHWQLKLRASDLANRVELPHAARTQGCVAFRQQNNSSCPANGGRSGAAEYHGRIRSSYDASAAYQPYGVRLLAFRHQQYQRFGLSKYWPTALGEVGLEWFNNGQLGGYWRHPWVSVGLRSDALALDDARFLQLQLGLNFHW